MIGLDTVFFTRNGFKKLKDLNLYDEVLTPLGMFEPIMKMSRIDDIDYYFKVSTDEVIECSKDLELPLYNENYTLKMRYIGYLDDKKYYTMKTLPCEYGKDVDVDYYEIGARIPSRIDDSFTKSTYNRYELFCGLMDTPMCSLKTEDGVYEFRPHSYEFEKDLVSLFRLFGFPVKCGVCDKKRYVKMGIQNIAVIDDIPIRDRYKDIMKRPPDNRYTFMPLKKTGKLKDTVKGRSISVNGGLALVGYSLIPVKCQIL